MVISCHRRRSALFFLALFSTYFINNVQASLTIPFREFLQHNYGLGLEQQLNRLDIGPGGSFGGGDSHKARTPSRIRPVILVHGITNTASTFWPIQKFFREHAYADEEVYGTTYGDGGKTNVLMVTMNCHYIKMLRAFIQSVADYTSSQVNVIGYSMGSPIARKAILGGACVDTGEQLGPPLTHLIYTFVGVAGANFGSFLCVIPFGSCNLNNGMACGSQFLNDINSRQRYEGQNIYTIYSTGDDKVGYMACGRKASEIAGQNAAFEKTGLNHDQLMFQTVELQYKLVTYNSP